MDHNIYIKFIVALAMGFIIGMEREFSFGEQKKQVIAGIRTFSLMGLLGCSSAMLTQELDSVWVFVLTLFIAGTFLSINLFTQRHCEKIGLTTEFAALMTIVIGALIYLDYFAIAIALGVTIMTLLSLKPEMHSFVRHLEKADIAATIKFAVISAIILPILPNQYFGPEPFHIFNPYKIWLLVVFISGISFVGYILTKTVGAKRGIGLLGLLGGLASSTAVTLTLSQRSHENKKLGTSFTFAILLAWTVMFGRLLAVVGAVNVSLIKYLWLPFLITVFAGLCYCFYLARKQNKNDAQNEMTLNNPFELGPAIKFGILFSIILLIAKAAQVYLGDTGIYLAGLISGFADVDAIALSVADLAKQPDVLAAEIAAKTILIATAANTFLKGMIVILSGAKEMRKELFPGLIMMILLPLIFILFI